MTRLLILAVAVALALLARPAVAASCGTAPAVAWRLTEKWGEAVVASETRDAVEVQLWVNRQSLSWTLTARHGPTMCIVVTGGHYAGATIADIVDGPGA